MNFIRNYAGQRSAGRSAGHATATAHRRGRQLYFSLAALLASTLSHDLAAAGTADGCPSLSGTTIRWIVPSRPGGGYDTYSRLLQPFLEERLGVRIHIDNRPEAGGIVGARTIRESAADGRTLGLISASGLLAAHAIDGRLAPNPLTDFTVIGQVISNHVVMFTGRDSGLKAIDDLLATGRSRPIVAGVRDAGSTSFFSVPVAAALLGLDYVLVTGYVGSSARTLAVMRGEVDIVIGHFDSMSNQVRAGELIPLLQLTASVSGSELDVPQLGGPAGLARQRAAVTGRSPEGAEQAADDLAAIVGAGRVVVGPPGLPSPLATCLDAALGAVLHSAELSAAARRAQLGIQHRDAAATHRDLVAGARGVAAFHDLIRAAVEQARE